MSRVRTTRPRSVEEHGIGAAEQHLITVNRAAVGVAQADQSDPQSANEAPEIPAPTGWSNRALDMRV